MNFEDLLEKIDFEPDCPEEDEDDDENESIDLTLTRRKKEKQAESLDQLFTELINSFNRMYSKRKDFLHYLDYELDQRKYAKKETGKEKTITHATYRIKHVTENYLNANSGSGDVFILLPDKDGARFQTDTAYHFFVGPYKDHLFLLGDCLEEEYGQFLPLLEDLDTYDQLEMIRKAKEDPEGWPIWVRMGKVKRKDLPDSVNKKRIVQERTEEILKRIPETRDDLYLFLNRTLTRYRRCGTSDEAEVEATLSAKAKLILMLLSGNPQPEPIDPDFLRNTLTDAVVTERDILERRSPGWLPNILIVGHNYRSALRSMGLTEDSMEEISMGGVEANDYLFGDPMSYYCSGFGQLVSHLTRKLTPPSFVFFRDTDLMGTTVRSSNPVYGLTALLREHAFIDYYMQDFPIDINSIQLICHTDSMQNCPPLLLNEIDVIVEPG